MLHIFTAMMTAMLIFGLSSLAYSNGYPKIANLWYNPNEITPNIANRLLRYDLLMIDVNAIAQSEQEIARMKFERPDVPILVYVNPLETWKPSEDPATLPFQRRLRPHLDWQYFFRDRDGAILSQGSWPRLQVMNLTSVSPLVPPVGTWIDLFLETVTRNEFTRHTDGFFFDNINPMAFYAKGSGLKFDLDFDGVTDTEAELDRWHQQGTGTLLADLRSRAGEKLIVGNGGRLSYADVLNGTLFEEFPAPWIVDGPGRTFADRWRYSIDRAIKGFQHFLSPTFIVLNGTGDAKNFRQARFTLTSALMVGAYASIDRGPSSHTQLFWFDEFAVDPKTGIPNDPGAIANRGYLGQPKGEMIEVNGVFARQFDHGLALCNPSANAITLTLGKPWKLIRGTQDPQTNTGETVTSLTVNSRDGRILLRL